MTRTTRPAGETASSGGLGHGDGTRELAYGVRMPACPRGSSIRLVRDGDDRRGRLVYVCRSCGRQATADSPSLVSEHRLPREVILLAVRDYLY